VFQKKKCVGITNQIKVKVIQNRRACAKSDKIYPIKEENSSMGKLFGG
jgi:hypothetical protein